MDIQKDSDREAFEAWYCRNHTGLKQSDLAKFRTPSGYCFSDPLKINISWEAWQAAKAQAVPKGFVVVPKEPTDAMLFAASGRDIVAEHYGDENILWPELRETWKAMIEAQEQNQ